MKSSSGLHILICSILLTFIWRSEADGQLCPPGQVTHIDGNVTRCCLPTDCGPKHYLKYCERNGTHDTCHLCPDNYGLFKRTSSFAVEPCHRLHLHSDPSNQCLVPPGSPEAWLEDMKNCFCNLEDGNHYLKPQIPLGPSSYCQPMTQRCNAGYQPTQDGKCEPCPRNTVQDKDQVFKLCRPQRNCTAMRLRTDERGNSMRETLCAKPPPIPQVPPSADTTTSPRIIPGISTKPVPPSLPDDISVQPSRNGSADSDAPWMIVVAVVCTLALVCVVLLVIIGRRRGWCVRFGKCHGQDVERNGCPGGQMPMPGQDNDNTSDNSCCACADNCLPSANKGSNNAVHKPGASICEMTKATSPPKLAMLEGYRNGKCNQSSPNESLSEPVSEPFYNSINTDRSTMDNDSMPTYKNVNNYLPSMQKPDIYSYPNKVDLPPSVERQRTQKPQDVHPQQGPAKGREGKEREEFTETDPLLPNLETCSSGIPTPLDTPVLRGILRNGNNYQEPRRGHVEEKTADVEEDDNNGNRPHLSMLLESSQAHSEESQAENVPHLSQLISVQNSNQGPGSQRPPQVQHQQLQQQAARPQHQVRQSPQQQRAKQRQQGSPQSVRLIPVSSALQPQPNPTVVQMEELKPVMPLNPGSAGDVVPSVPRVVGRAIEGRNRTGSPARINPSRHEEVRGNDGQEAVKERPTQADRVINASAGTGSTASTKKVEDEQPDKKHTGMATTIKTNQGATTEKELSEETFRKQEIPATSPDSEETMHKSVGGSSGLGDSLDISSALDLPSDDEGRSRSKYRRSNSEASRSVSPSLPLPASRSISTPDDRHRPFAVVKPMQSDQSLNAISGSQAELTQPLDLIGRRFPLNSLGDHTPGRQSSQESADDPDQTLPKTPDYLSEEEDNDNENDGRPCEGEERTQAGVVDGIDSFERERGGDGKDKDSDRASED